MNQVSQPQAPTKPTPNVTVSPIPPSSAGAKEYIDQASDAATAGDYRKAVTILDEAIKKFPNDQNLSISRDYYANQAIQHGQ
jgi:TolA-binding protein